MILTQGVVAYDIYYPKEMLQMENISIPEEFLDIFTDDTPMKVWVLLDIPDSLDFDIIH